VKSRRSFVRWNVLALISVASFVAYLLRTNMSVAGEQMMGELHLSHVQLGIVLATFLWGYTIFQFPGGVLGERLGARKGVAIIIALWGVLNMLMGLVPSAAVASPWMLIGLLGALRFLLGAAQGPFYPITSGQSMAHWFPTTDWPLTNAMPNLGLTLGAAATGPIIARMMEAFGWRASFVYTSPLALVVAAIWWWYVRDDPTKHRGVTPSELVHIEQGRPPIEPRSDTDSDWRTLVRNRDIQLLTASYFFNNYVFYFFFTWGFIYLVDVRKFGTISAGTAFALPWIAGAAGALLGGALCSVIAKRHGLTMACRTVTMSGLLVAAAAVLGAAVVRSPTLAVGCLAVCMAAQQLTDPVSWAAAMALGGRQSAAACGVMNTAGNAVGGLGAVLVPFIAREMGWTMSVAVVSAFAIVGAALWIWIRLDHPVEAKADLLRQAELLATPQP